MEESVCVVKCSGGVEASVCVVKCSEGVEVSVCVVKFSEGDGRHLYAWLSVPRGGEAT